MEKTGLSESKTAMEGIIRQIPDTSKTAYLTGMTALNIPSKNGTGDWHFHDAFIGYPDIPIRFFIAGVNMDSTALLFGERGIYDCKNVLKEYGLFNNQGSIFFDEPTGPIYAADHYRASADLALHYLNRNNLALFSVDDWLSTQEEKELLYDFLKTAEHLIGAEKWKAITSWMGDELTLDARNSAKFMAE